MLPRALPLVGVQGSWGNKNTRRQLDSHEAWQTELALAHSINRARPTVRGHQGTVLSGRVLTLA